MGAERSAGEIVGVGTLARARLIGGDVGVAADVEQPATGVVDRDRKVAADAVAVVEVEHRRPGLLAAVHATDRLDLLKVEREGVPVHVAGT